MSLGRWDVDGLLYEIPNHLFVEWMAYYQVEPFGAPLLDVHMATLESMFVNANRKRGASASKPKDFMLHKPSQRASLQSLWNDLKSWALMSRDK